MRESFTEQDVIDFAESQSQLYFGKSIENLTPANVRDRLIIEARAKLQAEVTAYDDLRDRFAMAALTGLMTSNTSRSYENLAVTSWRAADMVMKNRGR